MHEEIIKELTSRLHIYQQKLEEDEDYLMSEEMQEEYYFFKEEFETLDGMMISYDSSLKKKFDALSEEYENPDSEMDATLDMMFPDTDGEYD